MLSVAIITYNEEDRLPKTLEAIKDLADEIVVVDSGSTDKTVEIARSYGAKVYINSFKGYGSQKNYALSKTTHDWVLFLDADEIVSEELKEEIRKILKNPSADGYYIRRKTNYLGKFLNFVWRNDYVLRLVNKKAKPRWEGEIHEILKVNGKTETLKGVIYHYTYRSLEEHFLKSLKYARLSAQEYYRKGKKFRYWKAFINPFWAFVKIYVLQLGFLDGWRGFLIANSYWFNTLLKYAYLWELERKENGKR
jgi:glycosyltransferase involved in cell wall biosynthesis